MPQPQLLRLRVAGFGSGVWLRVPALTAHPAPARVRGESPAAPRRRLTHSTRPRVRVGFKKLCVWAFELEFWRNLGFSEGGEARRGQVFHIRRLSCHEVLASARLCVPSTKHQAQTEALRPRIMEIIAAPTLSSKHLQPKVQEDSSSSLVQKFEPGSLHAALTTLKCRKQHSSPYNEPKMVAQHKQTSSSSRNHKNVRTRPASYV